MAEQEAAEVDEEPEATASAEESDTAADDAADDDGGAAADDAASDDGGVADAVDERAAELTGAGGEGGGAEGEPMSEINRTEVDAATAHLDDANLADDRETLKKIQKGM
jgi:hypothetical protein